MSNRRRNNADLCDLLVVLFGGFGHAMAELEHSRVELSLKVCNPRFVSWI